jgi:hypothetical protein
MGILIAIYFELHMIWAKKMSFVEQQVVLQWVVLHSVVLNWVLGIPVAFNHYSLGGL